ncbi:MAG: hypothetical protein QGG40_19545 [Myxococcota bacterium]|jgi:hypothetical protein|nr:hypothetical protein [Myxococcota bacterium]
MPPSEAHTPVDPSLLGVDATAQVPLTNLLHELSAAGLEPEVQPCVGHRSGAGTVVAHLLLAGAMGALSLFWPVAVLGLLALGPSAIMELQGGRGWVRGLLIRDIGRCVFLRSGTRATSDGWHHYEEASSLLDPQPVEHLRPTLLLYLPLGNVPVVVWDYLLPLLLVPWLLCVVGGALVPFLPESSSFLIALGEAGLALGFVGVVIQMVVQLVSRAEPPPSVVPIFTEVAARLRTDGPLEVVVAAGEPGAPHHDALAVLLQNNRPLLDPRATRVLVLEPGKASGYVGKEGRLIARDTDPLGAELCSAAGLHFMSATSAAARAMAMGYRATGIRVERGNFQQVGDKVADLVASFEGHVEDERW